MCVVGKFRHFKYRTASSPTNALASSGVNMSWCFFVPTTGTYTLQLAGQPISTANEVVGGTCTSQVYHTALSLLNS